MIHTDWERQRETLTAYVDGELGAPERVALEAHLPGCAECQAEVAAQRQTRALLRGLPELAAPRAFTLPLTGDLPGVTGSAAEPPALRPRRAARPAPRWSRPAQWAGSVAAAVGLALLVGSALPLPGRSLATAGSASSVAASTNHVAQGGASNAPIAPTRSATSGVVGQPTVNATASPSPTPQPTPGAQSPGRGAASAPPLEPFGGATLLVGGAAALTAGSVARRRARRATDERANS